MMKQVSRSKIDDCVFLFVIVVLSALPYLFRLGFYSDDWDTVATFSHLSGQRLGAMFHYLATDPDMLLRPVQATFLVLGFKLFGRHALPYHIFNTALLGALTVCLYLTLRELQAQRWLAFAIALVSGLLPHYSTDRIWVSSQQAILCMTFALIGICALFRSIRPEEHHPKMWLVLAAFALVLSILSYEVALGLIAASVGMIAWRKYRDTRASSRTAIGLGGIAATAAVLLLVGMWSCCRQPVFRCMAFLSCGLYRCRFTGCRFLRFSIPSAQLMLPVPGRGWWPPARCLVSQLFWSCRVSSVTWAAQQGYS
jgi:hypothetical protein